MRCLLLFLPTSKRREWRISVAFRFLCEVSTSEFFLKICYFCVVALSGNLPLNHSSVFIDIKTDNVCTISPGISMVHNYHQFTHRKVYFFLLDLLANLLILFFAPLVSVTSQPVARLDKECHSPSTHNSSPMISLI